MLYLDIIPIDYNLRNQENKLFKFYLRNLLTNEELLTKTLPNNDFFIVQDIKFCKSLLLPNNNIKLIDYNLLTNVKPIDKEEFLLHAHYTKLYPNLSNVTSIISDIKLLEYCRNKSSHIKLENIDVSLVNEFYNDLFSSVIVELESNPINIDRSYFPKKEILVDGKLYSNYNIYNTYSRPTNVVGSFNLTSISTKDDTRKSIIPNNDLLIEFDYKNFQIHLLADLLKHSFKTDDIYSELIELYNSQDREESKKQTMYYLFGDIEDNPFPESMFFTSFFKFKKNLKTKPHFISPISGKKILLENTNKDIPRILQVIETEKNILTMSKIQSYLKDKKSKLILYFYDSFLIDYSKEDGKKIVSQLKSIIEQETKCSIKYGKNFKDMELIDMK